MATVFFTAGSVASNTVTEVIGSPADASPFQDTLLFDRDDPVLVSQIRYNVLEITITPGSDLQNTALPEDVNADGIVTPSDALTIINALARGGEGESHRSGVYTDVNGDSLTSPLDALRVINHLALVAAAASGEGEAVVSDLLPASDQSSDSDNDAREEAFADLNQQSKLVAGDAAGGQAASSGGLLTLADAEDEEDDVLSLLADDQSGLA